MLKTIRLYSALLLCMFLIDASAEESTIPEANEFPPTIEDGEIFVFFLSKI